VGKPVTNGRRRQPKQERARLTVEAIVEAAAQILESKGYERATTNLIAERAGVSVGTLYEYFADKEAVSQAVLERCLMRKLARMQQESEALRDLPFEPAIRRLLAVFLEEVVRQLNLTRILLGRSLYVPFNQESEEVAAGFTALVADFLSARSHEIRVVNLDMTLFVLLHSLDAVVSAAVVERPDYLEDPRLIDELVRLFASYLCPGSPQRD